MEILNELKRDLIFLDICEMIEEEILGDFDELGIEELTIDSMSRLRSIISS